MPHRSAFVRATAALALTMLSVVSACDGDPLGAEAVAGTYMLQSVNGVPLPVTITTGSGEAARVTHGSLVLQRDGRYLQTVHYSTADGAGNPSDSGAYARKGSTVQFRSDDRAAYAGQVIGNELTVSFDLGDADSEAEQLVFVPGRL